MTSKEFEKLDEIEKKILEILSKHPEGLSCRQIWNKLKDDKGRHLIAFPTLLNRLSKLEREGYLEIESSGGRGRKKVVKSKECYKDIIEKLSEIRAIKSVFTEYLKKQLDELKKDLEIKRNFQDAIKTYQKIELAEILLLNDLSKIRNETLSLNIPENLKKEIVFETFDAEKDIKLKFYNSIYRDNESFCKYHSLMLINNLFYLVRDKGILRVLKILQKQGLIKADLEIYIEYPSSDPKSFKDSVKVEYLKDLVEEIIDRIDEIKYGFEIEIEENQLFNIINKLEEFLIFKELTEIIKNHKIRGLIRQSFEDWKKLEFEVRSELKKIKMEVTP